MHDDADDGPADKDRDADGEADEEPGEEHILIGAEKCSGDKEDDEGKDLERGERKPQGWDKVLDEGREGERGDVGASEMLRWHRGESLAEPA